MEYIKVKKDSSTLYLRLSGTGPEQVEVTDTKTEFRYSNTTASFYGAEAPKLAQEFLSNATVANGKGGATASDKPEPPKETKSKK